MKTGIDYISAERERQVNEEGWTPQHDAHYKDNELAYAAVSYAIPDIGRYRYLDEKPKYWPWESKWWKPTPDDRIRELSKAGALIAAEIDRLIDLEKGETK